MQFGQLWDFADGGAETSSGGEKWPFAPPKRKLVTSIPSIHF